MNEINENLQRIRTLTVQATTGTNSAKDLVSINEEVVARVQEINRVSEQTQFNGVKVLDKGVQDLQIQVGAHDNETITIKLAETNSSELFSTAGLKDITAATDPKAATGILADYTAGTPAVPGTGTGTAATPGTPAVEEKATVAAGLLAEIDAAISKVDSQRSGLGAIQNRFQSTITNLNNTVNNLSSARSRIEDADYAVEVSNMTRAQILQQAGTSVLAQANQVPQTVLSLLR